ncbi:MAG: magnesium transporter [Pseudomonadota bacterium]|nr:magnesium transporter [Pseudomonadota bacterium]
MKNQRKMQKLLTSLEQAIADHDKSEIRRIILELPESDVAYFLEISPPKIRKTVWKYINEERSGRVLGYLDEELAAEHLEEIPREVASRVVANVESDDLADMLQELPEEVTEEIMDFMEDEERQRVEDILSYDENTAGGLMNTDIVTVPKHLTIRQAVDLFKTKGAFPESTDAVWVVRDDMSYLGKITLSEIILADEHERIHEYIDNQFEPINATMPIQEVANLFERRDFISAPVVDDNNRLIGRITVDDIVDVIIEEGTQSLKALAKMDNDEDLFAPVRKTIQKRAFWLGINLLTAILAATVIGLFSATIEKVVALAILMPIIASMGGIAGTQTLTLVIRGMALGHLTDSNSRYLVRKEMLVSLFNGLLWAVVVGLITIVWFQDMTLCYIIAAALILNLLIAAFSGAVLPLVMKKLKIDPALAGGVVLTTITDVMGFFIFLGLATIFYL